MPGKNEMKEEDNGLSMSSVNSFICLTNGYGILAVFPKPVQGTEIQTNKKQPGF